MNRDKADTVLNLIALQLRNNKELDPFRRKQLEQAHQELRREWAHMR